MALIEWVAIYAELFTYASFLSGLKLCYDIFKRKSCDNFSAVPFLAGFVSTSLWLKYGFISGISEIRTVNLIGLTFTTFYITFFFYFSREKVKILIQLFYILVTVVTSLLFIDNNDDALNLCGALASLSSILSCAAPLVTIKDVFKTKSTFTLPFPMILSSFNVSLSWLLYGYLKEDEFIVFTNSVAAFVSACSLSLFCIYPSTSRHYVRLENVSPGRSEKKRS